MKREREREMDTSFLATNGNSALCRDFVWLCFFFLVLLFPGEIKMVVLTHPWGKILFFCLKRAFGQFSIKGEKEEGEKKREKLES